MNDRLSQQRTFRNSHRLGYSNTTRTFRANAIVLHHKPLRPHHARTMFEPPRQRDEDSATPARRGQANCRTCTDFKTWTMQQTANTQQSGRPASTSASTAAAATTTSTSHPQPPALDTKPQARDCPYDKDELGNATWGLLHTMAAHYPDKPTVAEEKDMSTFFTVLSKFYPCEPCAKDLQQE